MTVSRPPFPFNILPTGDDAANPERLRHVRAYLRWCAERAHLSRDELMEALGYRKTAKFVTHCAAWHACERRIPLRYLQVIGVDLDVLETAIGLDRAAALEQVKRAPLPSSFIVRYYPAVYGSRPLPSDLTEEETIEFVRGFAIETGFRTAIKIAGGLRIIFVEPTGEHHDALFLPTCSRQHGMLRFSDSGELVGRMRVRSERRAGRGSARGIGAVSW